MKIIRIILIIGLALTAFGCAADHSDGRDAIAVSLEPQAWIVEQIAGNDIDIITLLPPGSDPEVYQPSISTMQSLGNAKAYFTLGTAGFEETLTKNIAKNFPDLKIIDSAEGVKKLYGSHSHTGSTLNNHNGDFDPHLLTSFRNSIVIADNISKTLAEIYPDKASEYIAAGNALKKKLTALNDSVSHMSLSNRTIVIRHPSLSYYARDYGVKQIALSDVGKETSPIQLKNRIEAGAKEKPSVMIIEREHASSSDYDTARMLGIDTIQVALNSSSWLNDLMRISHEINRD